jgi:hypothetical protein
MAWHGRRREVNSQASKDRDLGRGRREGGREGRGEGVVKRKKGKYQEEKVR